MKSIEISDSVLSNANTDDGLNKNIEKLTTKMPPMHMFLDKTIIKLIFHSNSWQVCIIVL
jgi:hypothetical protein